MPVDDDAARAGWSLLRDRDGAEIGRFTAKRRDGRRVADLFELADGVAPERAARVIAGELSGWRVAVPVALGQLLVDGGGRANRHGHVMSRDLVRDPPSPAWLEPSAPGGIRLTPADRPAIDLATACYAAYPRDHPDYDQIPDPEKPEIELEEIMSGRLLGPLLRCSGLAVAEDGTVAGAVLVNAIGGDPPFGGPWITQIFRHPEAPRGIGAALLRRSLALAARDGLPALSLAVTDSNPARGLYSGHGFAAVWESLTVDLP
jgi:hypothetical protein